MDCSEFNRLLDSYIDGDLSEAQRDELGQHAAQCAKCREELAAAEQLRGILSHLNDDISVPLPAQAAWRKAVREEAHRRRMKRVYSAVGAVAAAFVLLFGVSVMLRPADSGVLTVNAPRVETDGVSEAASIETEMTLTNAKTRSLGYIERSVTADDVGQTYEYLLDVIAEYGGTVERESDGDERKVFVQIPGENALEFLSAVDGLGETAGDEAAVMIDESAASVGICVTIAGM